jgi:hypothetical protein
MINNTGTNKKKKKKKNIDGCYQLISAVNLSLQKKTKSLPSEVHRIQRPLAMVYTKENCQVSGLCPSSTILNN